MDGTGRWTTDTSMTMAAAGARGVVVATTEDDPLELALRTDAVVQRMTSDAATGETGNLAASESGTSRVRVILEGSRAVALAGGGALVPTLEMGLRRDGGDAETGTGIELGGGVELHRPRLGADGPGEGAGPGGARGHGLPRVGCERCAPRRAGRLGCGRGRGGYGRIAMRGRSRSCTQAPGQPLRWDWPAPSLHMSSTRRRLGPSPSEQSLYRDCDNCENSSPHSSGNRSGCARAERLTGEFLHNGASHRCSVAVITCD